MGSTLTKQTATLLGLLLGTCFIGEAVAQRLFESHESIEATVSADWRAVIKARAKTDRIWEAELRYRDGREEERTVRVGLSTRGLSRLDRDVCSFPGLFLHFEESDVEGTLFEQQRSLPLVSHCKESRQYQQYVIEEYLLYRVYNVVSDLSLRVRLLRLTYEPTGRGHAFTGHAFFVENYHALARRLDSEVVEITPFDPNDAEPQEMSLLEVYQYFIGNTDWSVVFQHNIVLLRMLNGRIRAVPYDLDSAGAINTVYAVPHPKLRIRSVRERLFRGVCRPKKFLTFALDRFRARRADIETLYRSQRELDESERQRTLRYYDEFYEVVNDPRRVRRVFVRKCRRIKATGR